MCLIFVVFGECQNFVMVRISKVVVDVVMFWLEKLYGGSVSPWFIEWSF